MSNNIDLEQLCDFFDRLSDASAKPYVQSSKENDYPPTRFSLVIPNSAVGGLWKANDQTLRYMDQNREEAKHTTYEQGRNSS